MRFISPSFLMFTLLISLLPWVEVRCEQVGQPPPFNEFTVVSQNAWQAAIGDSSGQIPDRRQFGPVPGGRPWAPNGPPVWKEPDLPAAPLVGVFLACVFAGAILGYALPSSRPRQALLGALCVTAVTVLVVQIAVGFPLKKLGRTDILAFLEAAAPQEAQWRGPNVVYTPTYTLWLYLSLMTALGGAVGVLVEVLNPPRKRRRWEDEEEDDEGDRGPPRRRRRRREEDEDDDEDRGPPRGRRPRDGFRR